MHPDLERLLSEDEAARAGVERVQADARARLESVGSEVDSQRTRRLEELRAEVDRSVASILADGEREVARRRAQRELRAREHADHVRTQVDEGRDLWVHIVRTGKLPGEVT